MDNSSCVPPFLYSGLSKLRRLLPRVLQVFLILGAVGLISFSGVRDGGGQGNNPTKEEKTDKPPHPTNIHRPTDPPIVPTDPPVVPTDPPVVPTDPPVVPTNPPLSTDTSIASTNTLLPTDTDDPNATPTSTPDCSPFVLTPTATSIPGIPTCTPTQPLTETDLPTDTVPPGSATSTPRPTKTKAPTETAGILVTPTASDAASGMNSASTFSQGMIGASATQSPTPTSNLASVPGSGDNAGSNPLSNVKAMPYLLFLATLTVGGGAIFAFTTRNRRDVYDPSLGASATLAIHPATVGASGFSAWLADQAPLLTDGEKVVLSKVGNGIISALHLSGRISNLTRISERGPQEFLQLATGPR